MIKNIPCRCSQANILDAVEEVGFSGAYDFFYLPCRNGLPNSKKQNYGYAFINFKTSELSFRFAQRILEGTTTVRQSPKVLSVAEAHIQGVWNLAEHFKTCLCMKGATPPYFADQKVQDEVEAAIFGAAVGKSSAPAQELPLPRLSAPPGLPPPLKAQQTFTNSCATTSSEQFVDAAFERIFSWSSNRSTACTESDDSGLGSDGDEELMPFSVKTRVPAPPFTTTRVPTYSLFEREPLYISVDAEYYSDIL
jgi:hypothetical protein